MRKKIIILLIIKIICLLCAHFFYFKELINEHRDRRFCYSVEHDYKTNFTEKEFSELKDAFKSKIDWILARENDGLGYGFLLIFLIFNLVIILTIFCCANINSKKFIKVICLSISIFPLILPIYLDFTIMIRRIKPINLDKKFYSTENVEFNKLISDKISNLNLRAIILIISFILFLISAIIIIILIVDNFIDHNYDNKGQIYQSIPNAPILQPD